MGRPRKHPHRSIAEAEAALTDAAATFDALLKVAHRVNPTRLELDRDERELRYRLKSALQSALIERYGERLSVTPTRTPGIVSLRVEVGRGDGGHARLASLSESAQRWVRERLAATTRRGAPDTRSSDDTPTSAPSDADPGREGD